MFWFKRLIIILLYIYPHNSHIYCWQFKLYMFISMVPALIHLCQIFKWYTHMSVFLIFYAFIVWDRLLLLISLAVTYRRHYFRCPYVQSFNIYKDICTTDLYSWYEMCSWTEFNHCLFIAIWIFFYRSISLLPFDCLFLLYCIIYFL